MGQREKFPANSFAPEKKRKKVDVKLSKKRLTLFAVGHSIVSALAPVFCSLAQVASWMTFSLIHV